MAYVGRIYNLKDLQAMKACTLQKETLSAAAERNENNLHGLNDFLL